MQRLFPMPLQSAIMLIVWLLLNNSFSVGQIILGLILAIAIPRLAYPLQAKRSRIKKPLKALRFMLLVFWDIVVANFEVAIKVLMPSALLRPAFIAVPLDLREDLPITLLTSTVSLTPGTVSAEVSEDRRWLYVHALDMRDEAEVIALIKQRYERPLKEIFGC